MASGKFVVRIPRELHQELVDEAQHQGVSLNALVTAYLAAAVRWRADEPEHIT